ncbi:MAG: DUF3784 domain-containing protein [Bacteroidaceae bacterium]|nr:DUF3784 domain-containing protein [Bacteroidaceae bacterium]
MDIVYIIYVAIMTTCACVCYYIGRIIANGHGDSLIAGYNTAKKEIQQKYDITRLRRLVSTTMYVMAALLPLLCITPLLPGQYAMTATIALVAIMIVLPTAVAMKANKWTKKQ